MSQENVEIVRRIYEAFDARDTEASFNFYADEIEWDLSRGAALGPAAVFHGHDGVRESFRDLLTAFSAIDFEIEEMTACGDRVLANIHERYRGRGSGVEVDRRHHAVWTLRGGKVTNMTVYRDRAEALEAVGLSE
jgi:uncharacterized protein